MIKGTEQIIIKSSGKKQKAKINTTKNIIKSFVLCAFPFVKIEQ